MTGDLLHLDIKGHIAVVTIDNPPLNIITEPVRKEMNLALDSVEANAEVRALVITGAGNRAFCAGADLNEEAELTAATVRTFIEADALIYDRFEGFPVPTIAAINGHCMGGGLELALSCDLRVAANDAKHRGAGVTMGLVVSTTRMTRIAGPSVAKGILLTGRTFLGEESQRVGLAHYAVPRSQVLDRALAVADDIAGQAPMAVRRTKESIHEAVELPFKEAIQREYDHFAELSQTRDHKHAIESFFRKERPIFENR